MIDVSGRDAGHRFSRLRKVMPAMTRTPFILLGLVLAVLATGMASTGARAAGTRVAAADPSVSVDLSAIDDKPAEKPRKAKKKKPAAKKTPAAKKPAKVAPAAPTAPAPVAEPPVAPPVAAPPAAAPPIVAPPPPAPESAVPVPAPPPPPAPTTEIVPPLPAPPVTAPKKGDEIAPVARLGFASGSDVVDQAGANALDALVAANAGGVKVMQVKAFAAGTAETNSAARRLSLKRAIAVRTYLIEKGMRATRIDVRALGIPTDAGPSDRVDVIILP